MKSVFLGIFSALLLTGCTTVIDDYKESLPKLEMTVFFEGKLCAWGIVRDRGGTAIRQFSADIIATASEDKVTLDEVFLFDDGERQTRLWEFEKSGNIWKGRAGDVVGEAQGEIAGDTLHLIYDLNIKQKNGDEIIISMDDWLHLIDSDTLMGSTEMSKWGIGVGKIDIVMKRQLNNQIQCIKQ